MDKLIVHSEGGEARTFDFRSLCAMPEQSERPSRSFGGMVIGSVPLVHLVGDEKRAYFTFHSFDGYSTSLPWSSLELCVVSYRLDRLSLPTQLGGPFRVFILGASPHSCLKHVDIIELAAQPRPDVLPVCHHAAAADYLAR